MTHPPSPIDDLLIIGAGAAGLAAAARAASRGLQVRLIEHGSQPGRKLLLSGGGRCNFTHMTDFESLLDAYYDKASARFLMPSMRHCPPSALRAYFAALGLPSTSDDEGRVYPASQQSADLLSCLLRELRRTAVCLETNCHPTSIQTDGRIFEVRTIATSDKKTVRKTSGQQKAQTADPARHVYRARRLLICCGSASYPHTGSDGSLDPLLRELGHSIHERQSALSSIKIPNFPFASCSGMSLPDVALSLLPHDSRVLKACRPSWRDGHRIRMHGQLLLTHHGFSGPLAQDFSRFIKNENLHLHLLSAQNLEEIEKDILTFCHDYPKRQILSYLKKYFPDKLSTSLLTLINPGHSLCDLTASSFPRELRRKLAAALTDLELPNPRTLSVHAAMLNRGGIPLTEVNPATLESRIVPGLHFAGEILDYDGRCGGYNLQGAFASALLVADTLPPS